MKTSRRVDDRPRWLIVKARALGRYDNISKFFEANKLSTICQSAACPNLSECFSSKSAALLIMGTKCTRACSFCGVKRGPTLFLGPSEVFRIPPTLLRLKLFYVVITSVDRDDIIDGGAQHFARCAKEIRKAAPTIQSEMLLPDFKDKARHIVFNARNVLPHVMNHNIETVPRLYASTKLGSKYPGSLAMISQLGCLRGRTKVKSGFMLGLGETIGEVIMILRELEGMTDCIIIGQYLRPHISKSSANEYLHPNAFNLYKILANNIGLGGCWSQSMSRSSFKAAASYFHFDMRQQLLPVW